MRLEENQKQMSSGPFSVVLAALGRRKEALFKSKRPAAILAAEGASANKIQEELNTEKEKLKEKNREYWRPLISELRQLKRRQKRRG